MLFWDQLISAFGFGVGSGHSFELLGEGLVVEESPWVIELVVPCLFQLLHASHYLLEFAVPH